MCAPTPIIEICPPHKNPPLETPKQIGHGKARVYRGTGVSRGVQPTIWERSLKFGSSSYPFFWRLFLGRKHRGTRPCQCPSHFGIRLYFLYAPTSPPLSKICQKICREFRQERKFSPKRKFSAGHPAKTFGQALQILETQAFRNGHPARTSMKKLRSEKLRPDFSFPNPTQNPPENSPPKPPQNPGPPFLDFSALPRKNPQINQGFLYPAEPTKTLEKADKTHTHTHKKK